MTTAAITAGLAAPLLGRGHARIRFGRRRRPFQRCLHQRGSLRAEGQARRRRDRTGSAQVDSNRAGQVWAVRITDNGAVVVSRHATTAGPSGSFTIRKVIANRPGPDKIRARATFENHTCGGAVTL